MDNNIFDKRVFRWAYYNNEQTGNGHTIAKMKLDSMKGLAIFSEKWKDDLKKH